MTHACHYPPCKTPTKPRLAFCPLHWHALKANRKTDILYAYQAGRAAGKHPSKRWLAAMREAMADLYALDSDPENEAHSRELAAKYRG